MLIEERIMHIRSILDKDKSINVEIAAKLFNVSPMTIRRDLEKITQEDKNICRCHGGAFVLTDVKTEEKFEGKLSLNISGKKQIALRALDEIGNNDVIYLDAGTTTYELAKLLNNINLSLTVITNDIVIAKELDRENINVLVTGGVLQKSTWCLLGNIAEDALKKFRPKLVFMGCTAIDENFNILTPTIEKTTIKPIVVNSSLKSFLLADKNKFYKYSPYIINTLADYTSVITDKVLTKNESQLVEKMGINIITV